MTVLLDRKMCVGQATGFPPGEESPALWISCPSAAAATELSVYRVAAHALVSDLAMSELAAFRRGELAQAGPPPAPPALADSEALRPVYRGPGWIGEAWRDVRGLSGPQGYRLEIEGVGALSVSVDGQVIRAEQVAPSCERNVLAEAVLGPALILALALDGVFCLHASSVALASSVAHPARVVAFIGDSGSGKSTLARYLHAQRAAGWRRVADDILPVTATPSGPEALPHFPQLKLASQAQPALGLPERLPLAAVVLLQQAEEQEEIRAERLGPLQATLALARHTVAARLFDEALLARHLAFCAASAGDLPLWRLRYPHRLELLPRLAEAIAACLEACPAEEAAA